MTFNDFYRKKAQKSHREVCKALFPYYIKVCGEVSTGFAKTVRTQRKNDGILKPKKVYNF